MFEGIDGAGKTTQVRQLSQHLRATGRYDDWVFTRQPGGTEVGARLRELLLHGGCPLADDTVVLMFAADAAQQLHEVIRPALTAGRNVLSDRGFHSNVIYQVTGHQHRWAGGLYEHVWGATRPDMVLLLDIPVNAMLERTDRQLDQVEASLTADDYQRVRDEYLQCASAHPDRWTVIDGTASENDVHQQVLTALDLV